MAGHHYLALQASKLKCTHIIFNTKYSIVLNPRSTPEDNKCSMSMQKPHNKQIQIQQWHANALRKNVKTFIWLKEYFGSSLQLVKNINLILSYAFQN